ncbi:MAG: hypothetical protein IJL07_05880 [Lachnospiraceae bacterium]|nr:hypothetical protein [Lachnospiraceae bacterium]
MKIRRSIEFKAKPDALVVGDIISFKLLTGEKVETRAIKREGNRMLMWFEDCLKTRYSMNEENTNAGGWLDSDARSILNTEIINSFPDKVLKHMVKDDNGDWLHLLSIEEVFGLTPDFEETEESKKLQIPALKIEKSHIKGWGLNGETIWHWLRSPYASDAADFCNVNYNGTANCGGASDARGLAPAFYLAISNPSACPTKEEEA